MESSKKLKADEVRVRNGCWWGGGQRRKQSDYAKFGLSEGTCENVGRAGWDTSWSLISFLFTLEFICNSHVPENSEFESPHHL